MWLELQDTTNKVSSWVWTFGLVPRNNLTAMAFRSYSSVAKSETEDLEAPNTPHSPQRHQQCWPFSSSFWLSLLLSLSTILSFGILYQGFIVLSLSSAPIECPNPVIRREWRTLGKNEQIEYLEAVNCLRTLNSKIGMNHSLYDDFPFIHSRVGNYSKLRSKSAIVKTE
jgi:hypothetical protein